MPRHPSSRYFVQIGLYSNVSCFSELEERIANLPSARERGDAFEVFTEAYLATQRIVQSIDVWPFDGLLRDF